MILFDICMSNFSLVLALKGNLKSSSLVIGSMSYQSYLASSHAVSVVSSNKGAQILDSSVSGNSQMTSARQDDIPVHQHQKHLQISSDTNKKKKETTLNKEKTACKKKKISGSSAPSPCSNLLLKTIDSSLAVKSPEVMKTSPNLMKASAGLMTASPRLTKLTSGLMQMDTGLTKTSSSLLTSQTGLVSSFPQMKSASPTLGVTTPCRYTTPGTTSRLKSTSGPQGLENKLLLSTTGSELRSNTFSSPLSFLTQKATGLAPSLNLTKGTFSVIQAS